jgi:hypothetical protein
MKNPERYQIFHKTLDMDQLSGKERGSPGCDSLAASCKHDNEPSGAINYREFVQYYSDY